MVADIIGSENKFKRNRRFIQAIRKIQQTEDVQQRHKLCDGIAEAIPVRICRGRERSWTPQLRYKSFFLRLQVIADVCILRDYRHGLF